MRATAVLIHSEADPEVPEDWGFFGSEQEAEDFYWKRRNSNGVLTYSGTYERDRLLHAERIADADLYGLLYMVEEKPIKAKYDKIREDRAKARGQG